MKELAKLCKELDLCEMQMEALYLNNNRYLVVSLPPENYENV